MKDRPERTDVDIVAAVFIDDIELRQVPGPSTRIDLRGIQFSAPAPHPVPLTWAPHLVVLVRCAEDEPGTGALEVTYHMGGEQVARNVQPLQVEPGRFSYRLVRGEVDFTEYTTVEAHCRIDRGHTVVVPYTLMPPVDDVDEGGAP
ncbi:MAG: hypothetical protein ACE367_13400 [Acidimicrobiales bacterium]